MTSFRNANKRNEGEISKHTDTQKRRNYLKQNREKMQNVVIIIKIIIIIIIIQQWVFHEGSFLSTVSRSNLKLEMLVFANGGKPEKNPRSQPENQQQTRPSCDATSGHRTQATVVGDKCARHCAIPATLILRKIMFIGCKDLCNLSKRYELSSSRPLGKNFRSQKH